MILALAAEHWRLALQPEGVHGERGWRLGDDLWPLVLFGDGVGEVDVVAAAMARVPVRLRRQFVVGAGVLKGKADRRRV